MCRKSLPALFLSLGICLAFFCPNLTVAQNDKQKKRNFGSSLDHLKRDKKTHELVDTRAKDKPGDAPSEKADEGINLQTTLAVFDVLIVDKNNDFIEGLTKNDFVVYEDGAAQQIGTFARGDDVKVPRSIILVIDYSGSQLPYIETSVTAAKVLVSKLNPDDQMAVVTDDVELLCDYTKDKSELNKVLDSLRDKAKRGKLGKSKQFSALYAAINELPVSKDSRSIIIFQTDGDQYFGLYDTQVALSRILGVPLYGADPVTFGYADILNKIEHTATTVYSIIPSERLIKLSPEDALEQARKMIREHQEAFKIKPDKNQMSEVQLKRFVELRQAEQASVVKIAAATGGWTGYLPSPDNAAETYDSIFSDISHRYIIGYYPTNTAKDGKKRALRVEVRGHPEFNVLARAAYFAPDDSRK